MKNVLSYAEFLNAEISLQSIAYRMTAFLSDSTVENFQLYQSFMVFD